MTLSSSPEEMFFPPSSSVLFKDLYATHIPRAGFQRANKVRVMYTTKVPRVSEPCSINRSFWAGHEAIARTICRNAVIECDPLGPTHKREEDSLWPEGGAS